MSKPYSQPGEKGTDTNQASEEEQNKRDIIAALANDYYEQLKNDTPYINMTFEEAGCACRDFARQDVEDLIRTEKLKLLAEVREQAEEYELNMHGFYDKDVSDQITAVPLDELTKLEAEL